MSMKGSLQNEIDVAISLFSKGNSKEALTQTLALIERFPEESILFNICGACYASLNQSQSAINYYKKALYFSPKYSKAHFNLAITLQEVGDLNDAIKSYEKAIEINSEYVEAYNNLGNIYKDLKKNNEAIFNYKKALNINPKYIEASFSLAEIQYDEGLLTEAMENYKVVVNEKDNLFQAWYSLGIIFKELGQTDKAISSFKKAVDIRPDFIEAYNELGMIYSEQKEAISIKYYKNAITLDSQSSILYFNLGNAYKKLDQVLDAIESYEEAILLNPNYFEAFNNLGFLYKERGQHDLAIKNFKSALSSNPSYADAFNNLGITYFTIGEFDKALKCYESAIKFNEIYAEAFANKARLLADLKRYEESVQHFERAIEINPNLDNLHGGLLGTKMYMSMWDDFSNSFSQIKDRVSRGMKTIDPFSILALEDNPDLHLKVAKTTSENFLSALELPSIKKYKGHKKIKIGYFSADFREHPVSYLTAELFEVHSRYNFEIHAFSFGPDTNDEMNLRIKSGVDYFHDIRSMSHLDSVKHARYLEIDIAVDLGGYTANSRTEIFAMRVAPIQLSYIGFLGTMGSIHYDYLIADEVIIPKENQKYYLEKIIYLPCFQVNDSKQLQPDKVFSRKDLGLPNKGFVFCCFNNTFKITPETFDSWARILAEVDESVIMLYVDNKIAKNNLQKEIKKRNVDLDRIIFSEHMPKLDYLARYKSVDLFLDTHPYNAGTTASDALRMGLPVLTYLGKSFASRMCSSILSALCLPELICNNQKEYELKAIDLAKNPEKISKIKEKLSNNLISSQLFNTKQFTQNLEAAYLKIYDRKNQNLENIHVYVEN